MHSNSAIMQYNDVEP